MAVTLAWLERRPLKANPDKDFRFLLHLVRDILDHAATAEEAARIADAYNVFDNGLEIICHHILIADPEKSLVLEWKDGEMHILREPKIQIVTNSPLLDQTPDQRRQACGRYEILDRRLTKSVSSLNWKQGLRIIKSASRTPVTQWSAVFDLEKRDIYLSLQRNFHTIYHFHVQKRDQLSVHSPEAG